MKKICPYQSHTYIGYDEIKVENCPIQEYYTEESEVCCYDSDYKNCPIYNLQYKIDKAIEYINKHCVNKKISKEVGYKCYTIADTNELEKIMNILGDDK